MTRSIRFAGVLVTAVLLAAVILYWRSSAPPASPGGESRPVRGGQLTAGIRTDPRSFNSLVATDEVSALVSSLTQGGLVRINKATFELEPWLAEKWEATADGRQYTLHLRPGLVWSDGTPLTSQDVLFTLRAVMDKKVESGLGDGLVVGGQPIRAAAPDERTVVLDFPGPSGLGLRLLDAVPILPRHKLEAAWAAGTLRTAW